MKKPVLIVSDSLYANHLTGITHPESPDRVRFIQNELINSHLLTKENLLIPRQATEEEIFLCHTKSYYYLVKAEITSLGLSGKRKISTLSTGDVQISPDSFLVALFAAGGALTAVDAVMTGKANQVFCNIRPPGHHACSNQGMGFCLFNNIAIAARYAQKKYGIKRILIVDWDVHHGNGTEEIFYEDPTVFYFSTHQEGLYPGTGAKEDRGIRNGFGTTLNFPIAGGSHSRQEVLEAFNDPLNASMENFQPELILISAGFDAHELDPLGGFNLQTADFENLTLAMNTLARKYTAGKIVSILEGGYHLRALAESVKAHVKALG